MVPCGGSTLWCHATGHFEISEKTASTTLIKVDCPFFMLAIIHGSQNHDFPTWILHSDLEVRKMYFGPFHGSTMWHHGTCQYQNAMS